MRPSRHAPLNSNIPDPPRPDGVAAGLTRLAASLDRLTSILETGQIGLGGDAQPRYTRPPEGDPGLAGEKAMAAQLGISRRTLGKYRREGRMPGCWIRNGGRILWKVHETRDAWQRGIA